MWTRWPVTICDAIDMTTNTPITCAACRAIDRADGVEDGNLYKIEHYQVRSERALLRGVMRAQDRAADRVTARDTRGGKVRDKRRDHVPGAIVCTVLERKRMVVALQPLPR